MKRAAANKEPEVVPEKESFLKRFCRDSDGGIEYLTRTGMPIRLDGRMERFGYNVAKDGFILHALDELEKEERGNGALAVALRAEMERRRTAGETRA